MSVDNILIDCDKCQQLHLSLLSKIQTCSHCPCPHSDVWFSRSLPQWCPLDGGYVPCIYRMPGGLGSLLLCACSMCDGNCSSAITSHCLLILQKRSRSHSVADYSDYRYWTSRTESTVKVISHKIHSFIHNQGETKRISPGTILIDSPVSESSRGHCVSRSVTM